MKILEKTIFKKKNKIINDLEIKIHSLNEQLEETNKLSSESLANIMMENTKLRDKLSQTEKARRKCAGAIGGLKKDNNKLLNRTMELNEKIIETRRKLDKVKNEYEEFKKNKFVVKELKAEKVPRKRQVMNVKSGAKTSRIISKIKPIEDETK